MFLMAHKKGFGAVVDVLNENPISCNLSHEITPTSNPPTAAFLSLRHPHAYSDCVIGWLLKCDLLDAWAAVRFVFMSYCASAFVYMYESPLLAHCGVSFTKTFVASKSALVILTWIFDENLLKYFPNH